MGLIDPECLYDVAVVGAGPAGLATAVYAASEGPSVIVLVCRSFGHGDIPSSVRAIKHGAVGFLTKPFNDVDLMRAVRTGLAQDREARLDRAEMAALRERY